MRSCHLPLLSQVLGFIEAPDSGGETVEGISQIPIMCDLDASIQCKTMDGAECLFLPISKTDMMCQEAPHKLTWLYMGGSCNARSSIACNNIVPGGTISQSFVHIKIHGEEPDEIYFQDIIRNP
jgi:hypothetical protein